jgi:prepilin-type N-terminal cleavage/methylation domain-containing protein
MFAKQTSAAKPPGMKGRFRILNRPGIGSQAGFTLIEIIVSLILVGVLAAMGGMAIVQVVQGYMMTRENSATTQKAQLAMSRITREIIEMINIPSDATATALPINNAGGNRTIGLNSGALKMAFGADTLTNGDILIDNVSAFTLVYYSRNASSGAVVTASTWPSTNDITTLTTIDVNLQISRTGGGTLAFANRVAPRNNKNEGGAPPSGSSFPIPSGPTYAAGGACFVATAAYGDPGHPMVRILRDFRDRYLLSWSGGRRLVEQYYAHGPAAADLIRNRPLATAAVRGLLAPVVVLTFFLLYAPLAIPVILILSLIMTGALCSAVRRGAIPLRSGVFHARGSVLIGLIVTMVIMATLSAAMLPMFSASYMNQVYADQGRKTYFLAESGFRYAASQFLNATGWTAKLAAMTAMNNKTCNLLNSAGSFTTLVYPFWFKSQTATAGATTLSTQVYGTIPAEFNGGFSAGRIRVGSVYYSYSSGSGSGTTITFSGLSPALPAIPATPQLDVQPATQTGGSAQSLSKSGSLTLSATGSGVFPLLNGNFILNPLPAGIPNGAVFNYTKRTGSTLSSITLSNGNLNQNWTGAVSVAAATNVILDKFIRLSSTGTLGGASREVIYNVPVGGIGDGQEFMKAQDIDLMNTGANWAAPSGSTGFGGTSSVQTIDGGSALKVDSAPSSGVWGNWAQTFFSGYSNTNLANAWMDAQGFLSYDLQVKVYNTQPYFFAGMNFRARNNSDNTDLYMYGVSFIKPRQISDGHGNWSAPSDLATELIPGYAADDAAGPLFSNPDLFNNLEEASDHSARYGLPAIVLWKRTSAGFTWLAYRKLTTADGVVTYNSSGKRWRLVNWSTLMVRVSEGYSLTFGSGGGISGVGVPIKEGDIIETIDRTSSARVVMTPILTGGSWTNRNAAGTLVLANILPVDIVPTTPIANNVPLYVNGVRLATATGGIVNTKKNYLRVYFTDPTANGTANNVETDSNNRLANPRGSVNWPPDDLTDLAASTDYVTLVQWTDAQYSQGAEMAPPLTQGNWTLGGGWQRPIVGTGLRKTADGTGTAVPSPALAVTAGVTYDVSITLSSRSAGSCSYSLGGVAGNNTLNSATTYTDTITATTTGNLIFTPTNTSRFVISAISVRPRISIAVPSTSEPNAIIVDGDLTTPAWTSTSTYADFTGDSISLSTSGGSAALTYYDDFAVQLDQKAGTGFLPPIQQ